MYIMTYLKMNSSLYAFLFRIAVIMLLCSFTIASLTAQDKMILRLSGGAGVGYASQVTFGSRNDAGMVLTLYGELEYGQLIGRLQYTNPSLGTFEESSNLNDGEAFHGALGYRFDFAEKFALGLLVSGGATIIRYTSGLGSDQFTNVSPQVGIILSPTYQLTDAFALQAGLRYHKGFKAGDRGRATDLTDFSVGIRYSLLH